MMHFVIFAIRQDFSSCSERNKIQQTHELQLSKHKLNRNVRKQEENEYLPLSFSNIQPGNPLKHPI